jgi:hypothetical protein
MKRKPPREMTVEQLVEHFVAIAVAQDQALDRDDTGAYNRLFSQMQRVREELRSRAGDQRRVLVPLLAHPNVQVRLVAAMTTLAIAPEAARRALKLIKERKEFPQAADASMTLRSLEDGTLIPT